MTVPLCHSDGDLSLFGCVLNRIVQEVHYYLLEPRGIGLDFNRVGSVSNQ